MDDAKHDHECVRVEESYEQKAEKARPVSEYWSQHDWPAENNIDEAMKHAHCREVAQIKDHKCSDYCAGHGA